VQAGWLSSGADPGGLLADSRVRVPPV